MSKYSMIQKTVPFYTALYFQDLKFDTEKLYQAVLSIKEITNSVTFSNQNGWQSPAFHFNDNLVFLPLLNQIKDTVDEIYKDLGIKTDAKLGDYWFNVNSKFSYNTSHNHPGSLISAVYYIKSPINSGRLVFERPDPFNDWILNTDPNENNIGKILQEPRENMLVLFPSYIKHYVEMNQSESERVSMALNFA